VADYKGNVNKFQSNFLKINNFQLSTVISLANTVDIAIFRLQVIQSNIQHTKRCTVS